MMNCTMYPSPADCEAIAAQAASKEAQGWIWIWLCKCMICFWKSIPPNCVCTCMYLCVLVPVDSPTEKSREFVCSVTSYNLDQLGDRAECTGAETNIASSRSNCPLSARVGQVGDQGQYCRLRKFDICCSSYLLSRAGPLLLVLTVAIASAEYGHLQLSRVSWEHFQL